MPKTYRLPGTCNNCAYKKGTTCEAMYYPVGKCFADKAERDGREDAIQKYTGKSKTKE